MNHRHHLAEVIGERTLHLKNPKQLAKEIAAYLLDEKGTAELDSLLRDIMQHRAEHGVVEATLVSAHELNDRVLSDVRQLLHHEYPHVKNFIIDRQIDPSVVGGMRVDLPNEQLDLSVRAQLTTFKRLTVGSERIAS